MPKNYPIDYFHRFSVDRILIENLINQLKDDDVYQRLSAYPDPEHRSVALSDQAQIIFVLMAFCPKILNSEDAKMREIVDKHFPDNWIIPVYQGHLVDLTVYWGPFPAARKAMDNNIVVENIKKIASVYYNKMQASKTQLKSYLIQGKLLEEYVLDHIKQLLKLLRDANVTVRWVLLHKTTRNKAFLDILQRGFKDEDIVDLILKLSKFESLLKSMLNNLVTEKVNIWA